MQGSYYTRDSIFIKARPGSTLKSCTNLIFYLVNIRNYESENKVFKGPSPTRAREPKPEKYGPIQALKNGRHRDESQKF